jgi:hypothetical protein
MKAFLVLALLAQAQVPSPPAPVMRGDAHVALGWQNLHDQQPGNELNSNRWLNDILYGGAGLGWYWTDHWKTQAEFGAGTHGESYRYRQFVIDGNQAYESSRIRTQQASVSVGQQYQFFRNQWFHPHVGGGLDLARRSIVTEYQPIPVYDSALKTYRTTPAHTGFGHDVVARPFAETGFKAYMSRRAFFTSDARLLFRSGVDEVLFRFGFGFDF